MGKLDELIATQASILDHLKLLREIEESGNCNVCTMKLNCEYSPDLGQLVRYNCPFFMDGRKTK